MTVYEPGRLFNRLYIVNLTENLNSLGSRVREKLSSGLYRVREKVGNIVQRVPILSYYADVPLSHYAKVVGSTSIAAPIVIAVAQAFSGVPINPTQIAGGTISADIIMSVFAPLTYEE